MYKKIPKQPEFVDFYLPFGGKLCKDNKWIILANLIPWDEIENKYSKKFAKSGKGAPGIKARVAIGALIIKEKCKLSDEDLVEHIQENPYMQYFLGYHEYRDEKPFDPSMMVHFRKRFSKEMIEEINEQICLKQSNSKPENTDDEDKDNDKSQNKGKLIVDTTCAPQDIKYPTDLNLLNEAREKTEKIIDKLYLPHKGKISKPRTYRQKARKDYLSIAKKRKVPEKILRKGIKKQLGYVGRNLRYIKKLSEISSLRLLSKKQYRDLLVINELYRQQKKMYDDNIHSIECRIVSISQPHIRPITRGKSRTPVEFGTIISMSLIEGYCFLERLSWENYHEGIDLIPQVKKYKQRFGFYPESVHADKKYRTRDNCKYLKGLGIRIAGPALGRPAKNKASVLIKEVIKQDRMDHRARIPVEGKFGEAKRRYSLGLVKAKLQKTTETWISIVFLVMNLNKRLRSLLLSLFRTIYNLLIGKLNWQY